MSNDFDLDLSFQYEPAELDLSRLGTDELQAAVAGLPTALREVATGLLLQNRTMSDVSQALGIRQSELVTRLHRAKNLIAEGLA
jgi:DNA-directed RNA polymerase specialized sigma24 family protein